MRRTNVAALLLVVGVLSCGGDAISGPGNGQGNISVSGAVSASGEGLALFQSGSSGGQTFFQVAIQPSPLGGGGEWQLQIVRYAARPVVGSYQIGPLVSLSADPTATFFYTGGTNDELFTAVSGQLNITSSSASRVRGTYNFTAQSTSNPSRTVTVQGAFSALCPATTSCM